MWRSLTFTNKHAHRLSPSLRAVKKLMSYSGNDVRELVIMDVLRFRLNQPKLLSICQGSKNLERLKLCGTTRERLQILEHPPVLTKLTHIDLREIAGDHSALLAPLLINAAENLQSIRVAGLPQVGSRTDLGFPHLPALKYLQFNEYCRPYPLRLEIV